MKSLNRVVSISSLFVFVLISLTSFASGWAKDGGKTGNQDVKSMLEAAQEMELTASSAAEITLLLHAYLEIEKLEPNNYLALWKIGNYHMLMGAAHSQKTKKKKFHFREAIKCCEKAMNTNKDFAQAIKDGEEVSDACEKLTINEIDAMGYWYTSRFYYFKECLNPIGKVLNTRIVQENNVVIEHVDKLDPNWGGGGNYFSRAIYYIATPEKFGGSMEKADEEFASAILSGPDYISNRWGRAKYLYSLTGNIEGFVSDMNWVIQQDPQQEGKPYAWNVYFQNDAKMELEKVSRK
jgi:tetratricopeptide (TPR) repeat protein